MKTTTKTYFKVVLNLITALAIIFLVVFLVPKAIMFFLPFVIGWIVSLIARPIVKFFEDKLKIKRKVGSALIIVLVLAIVIAIVYAILYFLIEQIIGFVEYFPVLWVKICDEFEHMSEMLNGVYDRLPANIQNTINGFAQNGEKYFSNITLGGSKASESDTSAISSFVSGIPDVIMGVVMALLSSYFFVADSDYLTRAMNKYLPKSFIYNWDIIKRSMKKSFGGYFKAQLKVETGVFAITVVGLLIMRVPYAIPIALLVAFVDFLPVFGAGAVMIPWAIVNFFDKDFKIGIALIVIWGLGQLFHDMSQPKFVGESLGLDSIPTLFMLFIGFKLAGVAGMIISVPVAIIIKNLYEEGVFNTTIESIGILVAGFNRFRTLKKEDREVITAYETEVETNYKNKYGTEDKE